MSKSRDGLLLRLAADLNGEAVMRDYLRFSCHGCAANEANAYEGDNSDQFERWLLGVMRRAMRDENYECDLRRLLWARYPNHTVEPIDGDVPLVHVYSGPEHAHCWAGSSAREALELAITCLLRGDEAEVRS